MFGGRTNGLHTFTGTNDFPPQNQNEEIVVVNPGTWQVWTVAWSATDVPAAMNQPLYSSNQQSFQQGDNLYAVGGYGAPDLGTMTGGMENFGPYITNNSLTALSVNGMINAVVNGGDVLALSKMQQIHDSRLQATGGEMQMLGTQAFLVVGQDFEGQYFNNTATQTYLDEIQSFQIAYEPATPGSLAISNYQAQNDHKPASARLQPDQHHSAEPTASFEHFGRRVYRRPIQRSRRRSRLSPADRYHGPRADSAEHLPTVLQPILCS